MSSPLRFEPHLHTWPASACASDSPAAMLEAAAYLGIGAVAITDHGSLEGYFLALDSGVPEGLVLVPGVEASLQDPDTGFSADVLAYAADPADLAHLGREWAYLHDTDELLGGVPRERLFLAWAHPTGGIGAARGLLPMAERLLGMVDAVEGYNGKRGLMCRRSPALFRHIAARGLRELSGSDCHNASDVGQGGIWLEAERSPTGVIAGLRSAVSFEWRW